MFNSLFHQEKRISPAAQGSTGHKEKSFKS